MARGGGFNARDVLRSRAIGLPHAHRLPEGKPLIGSHPRWHKGAVTSVRIRSV